MPTSYSEVDICNVAMAQLGQEAIVTLADNTPQARFCARFYPLVRDYELRTYPWACCKKQVVLSATVVPGPVFGYQFRFALPADCIRVLNELDPDATYEVQGKYLYFGSTLDLSASTTFSLTYIAQITDTTQFDVGLIYCIAYGLAEEGASVLTRNEDLRQQMTRNREKARRDSRTVDSQESQPSQTVSDVWLRARS